MRPALPSLALGLVLGAAAGWFLARPSAPDILSTRYSLPATSWNWRASPTPPSLAPDAIGPAIAAWRDLRAADGSPASYAARAEALRVLLARLPADGFPRLIASLVPADTDIDRRLRRLAFDTWVEADAPAAARWAATGKDTTDLARQAIKAWAAIDAPAATEWACSLADAKLAAALAEPALAALAATDPARALALANSRDEAFSTAVLPALFDTLAKADPAAALRAHGSVIWAGGDGFWKLRDPLRAWARRDPDAVLDWIVAQPNKRGNQLGDWIGNLAETPEERRALADALARNPAFPQPAAALAGIFDRWDPAKSGEVLAWLDAHADHDLRRDVLRLMSRPIYSEHPERTLPYALALPASQNRTQTLARILAAWTKADSAAALAWIQTQADPGLHAAAATVQATLLADIARSEPSTAVAEWTALSDPRAQKASIRPIAEAWGKTDPGAALQWAAAQETALGVPSATPPVQLLYAWAQKDPEAALRWAESYVADIRSPQKEWLANQVLTSLGRTWQDAAPRAQTADLYSKINDPALRAEILKTHVAEWLTKDRAAAQAWLEKSSALTPAQAAELLKTK